MNHALKRRSIKRISFCDDINEHQKINVYIQEVLDAAYGCYIWPSSLVMSEFVWHYRHQFENKTVLEVGAGTSLPSLVLSKSTNACSIISDAPNIIPIICDCLQLNKLNGCTDKIRVQALEWGKFNENTSIDRLIDDFKNDWPNTRIDFILGSDTFYEPSQFENLLVSVSFIIHNHNSQCKFFTTYQERSTKRNIQYLLDKWGLKCKMISKDSFCFDELKYIDAEDVTSEVKVNAGTLASVFILEIDKK
ncbi:MAG: putative methyltransferase-domain-containing protein [Benjaminiella poitrasii]|nr:MAG: putative methyltransferase-domain-containing protein [Benjaminiella poitrasii]